MKRILIFTLALLCLTSAALADGDTALSTELLPSCYQYTLEGANVVYADAPVPVYASQTMNGAVLGYVNPNQHIHLDVVDRAAGMAYIYYYENDTQSFWNFNDDCPKGWIESRFTTTYTNYSPDPEIGSIWVVTTNKPGNRLNLRTQPTADSLSLGKYYAGTIVQQVEATQNGYMKVRIAHMQGYMDVRFLTEGLYTPDAELPQLLVTGANGAVMHKMPQDDSEIIKIAPQNAYVTVLAVRDDDWVQIIYENETGFALNSTMTPELSY